MNLTEFPEQNVIIAKDQPEYLPMPAHRVGDAAGQTIVCWKLSWTERLMVLFTGRIWHTILTFNMAMQPQLLQVDKPEMKP